MSIKFRIEMLLPPSLRVTSKNDRRHIHYVDHIIQKWLLVALVFMESALIAFAMWALYRTLGETIDNNIYRVHLSEDMKVLPRFLGEGVKILLLIGIVNLFAIIVADRIWAVYVHGIVRRLDAIMHAAQQLDFSEQNPVIHSHAVLEQAVAWRRAEAHRFGMLRREIASLSAAMPLALEDRAAAAEALARLRDGACSRAG